MPVISLTLDETNRSIFSSVYFKIIEDIVTAIKVPHSSLVVVHKDTETTLTDNKSNATGLQQDNLPSTISKRKVIATITENYNEDTLTTTAVHQLDNYPIFIDHDIDVVVYPIYVKSDIDIEFNYTTSSKAEANRVRDDLRIRLSQTRNITMHDIEYDIIIPEVVEDFITEVHTLKNRLVPQSLEDYFRDNSTKRIHLLTDMANTSNARLAINEKQVRIVGLFDFSSMPEKLDIDNDNNNYKVSFTYKMSFDVPRAMAIRYPVMICNRTLPSKYIQFIADNKTNSQQEYKRELGYTNSLGALSHFEAHRQLENRVDVNLPINIPLFDDFNTRVGHKGYGIITSFLTDVNETDKKTLFNLRELDPYYIQEDVLNFILNGEKRYIVNPFMSFFYFGLYQDGRHYDNNILEIDDNLNIKSKVELSLFKPVRVTLSIILDITALDSGAIDRLLLNLNVLYIFLSEYIRAYNNFKTENSTSVIPDATFNMIFVKLLNSLMLVDNLIGIKGVLDVLRDDKYIFNGLLGTLEVSYPNMLRYLMTNNVPTTVVSKIDGTNYNVLKPLVSDLDMSLSTKKVNYGEEINIMKTVMTHYIVALRMQQ